MPAPSPEPRNLASVDLSGKPEEIVKQFEEVVELRKFLRWGSDEEGAFAEYRLRPGEAIYSAVVVRFCGLVRADEVRPVARLIIDRNRIADETDMAIGTPIRIPYDLLEPEFRRDDDPEFAAYLQNLQAVADVSTDISTRNLEGVYIVLDAGHGGRDPGAKVGLVWEDDFVYDIVCRIKARLERESAATVVTTVFDPSVHYRVQDTSRFTLDHDEVLLTHPSYPLSHPRVGTDGVHLRYILANHLYHQWTKDGVKPENILFASIHADFLHQGIRGNMVYIPDARDFPKRVAPSVRFKKYREYIGNQFQFDLQSMRQAQARSMNFASFFISQSKHAGVLVHKQKPIRSVIHRNHYKSYVPAVVKFNTIPTRCLIEVCNLNNKDDRLLLQKPSFRQKTADVFVEAVYQTYGVPSAGGGQAITASGARTGK